MKKNWAQKAGILSSAALLLFAATGCSFGKSGTDDGGTAKLSIYTETSTYEGKVTGYMGKYLKDKLNLEVNVVPNVVGGSSRFETKLATGDLGDLIVFASSEDFKKAIDAGVVLNLKDEMNNLPNVSRFGDATKRVENNFGGLYGVPTQVSLTSDITSTNPISIPSLRFDYYQELGTPELKDIWDYYDVIEKMVKAHPTTESGNKFYGLSLFSEWDGTSVNLAKQIASFYGYSTTDGINNYNFVLPHATQDQTENILADESYYLKALKWFNKFYQAGMLDEDSVSQTWQDYLAKANKGQSAIWIYGYMGDLNFNPSNPSLPAEGKGYKRIPFTNLKAADAKTSTVGSRWYWAVSSSTKNKENALKLLDFLYSDEGALVNNETGPEGLLWKFNESGEPELTDLGKSPVDTTVPAEQGGGKTGDTLKSMINGPTVDPNSISSILKAPMDKTTWKSYLQNNATLLDKNWSKFYDGALSAKEYVVKQDMLAAYPTVDVPVLKYDDQLAVKRDQVGAVIKELSWKMIYAKNDAEFESLQKEMIKKARDLGYEECVAFEEQGAKAWFEARKSVN